MDRDADGHDVVGVVAEVHMEQVEKGVDGRTGGGEHEQGKGELAGDQRAMEAARP